MADRTQTHPGTEPIEPFAKMLGAELTGLVRGCLPDVVIDDLETSLSAALASHPALSPLLVDAIGDNSIPPSVRRQRVRSRSLVQQYSSLAEKGGESLDAFLEQLQPEDTTKLEDKPGTLRRLSLGAIVAYLVGALGGAESGGVEVDKNELELEIRRVRGLMSESLPPRST